MKDVFVIESPFPEVESYSNQEPDVEDWYELLVEILQGVRRQHKSSEHCLFLMAFIYSTILPRKFRFLAVIVELTGRNLNFFSNYCLWKLKMEIEQDLINENTEQDNILKLIVHFERTSEEFSRTIQTASHNKKALWREISKEQPKETTLVKLALRIDSAREKIRLLFKELSEMSENNVDSLELYTAYLIDIENNIKTAAEVYDRLAYAIKNIKNKRAKASLEVDSMAILIMSGAYEERGKVIQANSESLRLFGYSLSEMVDHPIEQFMPNFIARNHKKFMSRFYREGTSSIIGNRRKIFLLTKQCFIKEANLYVKVFPSLDSGIHIAGFMNTDNDENKERKLIRYLISYVEGTGELKYVCENSYKYMGLKSNTDDRMSIFLDKNNLKIMCPKLFERESEAEIWRGAAVELDTSTMICSKRSLLQELEDDINDDQDPSEAELNPLEKDINVFVVDEKKDMEEFAAEHRKLNKKKTDNIVDSFSIDDDIDFMYRRRDMLVRVFHKENFMNEETYVFAYLQDRDLSESFIQNEKVLELNVARKKASKNPHEQVTSKQLMKKKRRFLKRVENMIIEHREDAAIENSKVLKNLSSSSLHKLYILSGVVFLLLMSVLIGKFAIRFSFKSFALLIEESMDTSTMRISHMARLTRGARKVQIIALGKYLPNQQQTEYTKAISYLSTELDNMYMKDFAFEGNLIKLKGDSDKYDSQTKATTLLSAGKVVDITSSLKDQLNMFMASAMRIEIAEINRFTNSSDTPNGIINDANRAIYFIGQNIFRDITKVSVELEESFSSYIQSKLRIYEILNLSVFGLEILFILFFLFTMIPVTNRVADISRQFFGFLLCTDLEDLKEIIKRTKRFITIYVDSDLIGSLNNSQISINSDFDDEFEANDFPELGEMEVKLAGSERQIKDKSGSKPNMYRNSLINRNTPKLEKKKKHQSQIKKDAEQQQNILVKSEFVQHGVAENEVVYILSKGTCHE